MIVQVVPCLRLPRGNTWFDYLCDDLDVVPGTLVAIPWRNRTINGIVWSCSELNPHLGSLKKITQIYGVVISPVQQQLIAWMATYYKISLSQAVLVALSQPTQRQRADMSSSLFLPNRSQQVDKSLPVRLHVHDSITELEQTIVTTVQRAVSDSWRQVVVFVPLVQQVQKIAHMLQEFSPVCFWSGLSKGKQWTTYQAIAMQTVQVVITTRIGALLPFADHSLIVVAHAERDEYVQYDQNPRYDTIRLLHQRVELVSATEMELHTVAPSVSQYAYAKSGIWQLVEQYQPLKNIQLHALVPGRSSNQEHPLLTEQCIQTIQKHTVTFVYLNRRGDVTAIRCNTCGADYLCKDCGAPVTLYQNGAVVLCHECNQRWPVPAQCQHCTGASLSMYQGGTNAIVTRLRQFFSDDVVIQKVDKDTTKFEINRQVKTVIVGTIAACDTEYIPAADAVIVLDGDTERTAHQYASVQHGWQRLQRILRMSDAAAVKIIQTRDPETAFWHACIQGISSLSSLELPARKKYHYPPFVKLTKLLCAHYLAESAHTQAMALYQYLREQLTSSDCQVLPPQHHQPYKLHRRYYEYVLIKHHSDTALDNLIKNIDLSILVYRDPIS